jgi:hypothetical protein
MENKNENQIVLKLNKSIELGYQANKLKGFEKAFTLAQATDELKDLLTAEYMKPIMSLQGNKLGFKTDKDSDKGYPIDQVKNCLIEAVLTGVQVVGNQFNIIAGNCYITKEGFGYLLSHYPGLSYEIIPKLPRMSNDGKSAAINMQINWSMNNGEKQTREIEFPVKVNSYMGLDAIIGKATRKARAWLYNSLSGLEVSDGDVQDIKAETIESKLTPKPEIIPGIKANESGTLPLTDAKS